MQLSVLGTALPLFWVEGGAGSIPAALRAPPWRPPSGPLALLSPPRLAQQVPRNAGRPGLGIPEGSWGGARAGGAVGDGARHAAGPHQ